MSHVSSQKGREIYGPRTSGPIAQIVAVHSSSEMRSRPSRRRKESDGAHNGSSASAESQCTHHSGAHKDALSQAPNSASDSKRNAATPTVTSAAIADFARLPPLHGVESDKSKESPDAAHQKCTEQASYSSKARDAWQRMSAKHQRYLISSCACFLIAFPMAMGLYFSQSHDPSQRFVQTTPVTNYVVKLPLQSEWPSGAAAAAVLQTEFVNVLRATIANASGFQIEPAAVLMESLMDPLTNATILRFERSALVNAGAFISANDTAYADWLDAIAASLVTNTTTSSTVQRRLSIGRIPASVSSIQINMLLLQRADRSLESFLGCGDAGDVASQPAFARLLTAFYSLLSQGGVVVSPAVSSAVTISWCNSLLEVNPQSQPLLISASLTPHPSASRQPTIFCPSNASMRYMLPFTQTGACGTGHDAICPLENCQCCSQFGWCGIGPDFCGSGCQKGYGHCQPPSSSGSATSSATSSVTSSQTRSPRASPDGLSGPGNHSAGFDISANSSGLRVTTNCTVPGTVAFTFDDGE